MSVSTIEEALKLLLEWTGKRDIDIPARPSARHHPSALDPLVAVSDLLGSDFYSADRITAPLLSVQDTIMRPEDVQVSDGVRILTEENQGVWAYGYREDAPDQLLVSGDWCDRLGTRAPESWRPVAATTEDALITTALINGIFALCERHASDHTDDYVSVPDETNVLVWAHPAWVGWSGIWTNEDNSLLHFGGMGLTVRRVTRLVLAGAGAIGRRHLEHIAAHPDLKLAAVIDPNPAVAELTDAPVYARLQGADIDADGIVIATPTQDHEATFAQAAERGWSALVEKPIASDLDAADRMIAMAAKHDVHILTGHHRRFHPKVHAVRDALPNIGQPVLATVLWSVKKPEGYFDVPWRMGADGAPVRMNVSHELDLLQFLFGEVAEVTGLGNNRVRKTARVESGGLVLSFVSGLIATVAFADTTPSPYGFEHGTGENPNIAHTGENSMHITGTQGAIAFPSLTLWRGGKDWGDAPTPEQLSADDGIPLVRQLEHFARVIAGKEAPINDGASGRRTLELTLDVEKLTLPSGDEHD